MLEIQIIRKETHDLENITAEMQSDKWEQLENSYSLENLEKFVSNPNNFLLLAYLDGKVAGAIEAYNLQKLDARDKEMFLYSIETKPEFRQKGVARALMLELVEIAKKEGSYELWVPTDEDNAPANALYSSLGIKTNAKKGQAMYDYPL